MVTKKDSNVLVSQDAKAQKGDKLMVNSNLTKKSSECCSNPASCSSSAAATSSSVQSFLSSSAAHSLQTEPKKGPKTRIVVKCDIGFGNSLAIRGHGAGLNWDKGVPLKNIKSDEWVWETELPFSGGEFKVLINDGQYESGSNHLLNYGTTIHYTPRF